MMSGNALMSPVHPGWSVFIAGLARARTCFQTTENARALLEEWPGIDTEESLRALRIQGGHCDCQILNALGDLGHHAPDRSPRDGDEELL
jgi:hypothetical protein